MQLARFLLLATLIGSNGACRRSEGTYQGYADHVAAVGDSALLSVAPYFTLDSTRAVRWDSDAATQLERQATALGGIMRPDTVELFHRQMLEGLDSLVVAMRVLREREVACGEARTIDCVDARDFGRILGSMRAGARIYLDGRRRMRETLAPLGANLPDPPAISSRVLGSESRAAP